MITKITGHQPTFNTSPLPFPNDFHWYGRKRSKPGRSTKSPKQLEAIHAGMRQSNGNTLDEGRKMITRTRQNLKSISYLPEFQLHRK